MIEQDPLKPKITLWYDGQNPFSQNVRAVEIHWNGRLSVKRVYTSEEELARVDRIGKVILPLETALNAYEFRHISEEVEAVNSWP